MSRKRSQNRKLIVNKSSKRRMIQCTTLVNKNAVTRENIDGEEHIVIASYTLPFNIVMNGGFYPAEEIEKSYKSLERALAPVEHPVDSDGNFLLASDPYAIHNFYVGAFNANVKITDNRVAHDFIINVNEAKKTDKGKRLLDRIDELETSSDPRPVHTSVGVVLEVEELKTDKYDWIARNMIIDHNAILLDSVAAATPDQGVGMAVNSDGSKVDVYRSVIPTSAKPQNNGPTEVEKNIIRDFIVKRIEGLRPNAEGMSYRQIIDELETQITGTVASDWLYVVDLYQDEVIFETGAGYFSVPYNIRHDSVQISGIPIRVERKVEYQPKVNQKKGDEHMRELILNALAEAGISTDGLSDDELLEKYNSLQAKATDEPKDEKNSEPIDETVANAIKPLNEKIEALVTKINSQSEQERSDYITAITNSGKYNGIDEEAAKLLNTDTLKTMAASCTEAHGLPLNDNSGNGNNAFTAPVEMPE